MWCACPFVTRLAQAKGGVVLKERKTIQYVRD